MNLKYNSIRFFKVGFINLFSELMNEFESDIHDQLKNINIYELSYDL